MLVFREKAQVFQSPVVHLAFGLRQDLLRAVSAETAPWDKMGPVMDLFDTPLHPFTWSEGKNIEKFIVVLWLCSISLIIGRLKPLPCLAASFPPSDAPI